MKHGSYLNPLSLLILCAVLILYPQIPAFAYVGPGIGVAIVSYVFGPIVAIVSAVAIVLYFPVRWYIKKHKNKHQADHKKRKQQ